MHKKAMVIFICFIALVLAQELYREYIGSVFMVGIIPAFMFGTIWNMSNGLALHRAIANKSQPNFRRFKVVNIVAILFLAAYTIAWNLYSHRPTQNDEGSGGAYFIFLPVSGVVGLIALWLPYYSIKFVVKALISLDPSEQRKWLLAIAILFFPIGIWWIQPKIDRACVGV